MSVKKLPHTRKPLDISLDEWQAGLRKQFAEDQKFNYKNIGDHPVYSDFEVFNPETERHYKVSITRPPGKSSTGRHTGKEKRKSRK